MSEEELKRMEDFVNATLKSDKPNEYRLGYEDALRRCYYLVDNLQQRIDKTLNYIKEKYDYVLGDATFLDHDELVDRKQILHILEILGDKENE